MSSFVIVSSGGFILFFNYTAEAGCFFENGLPVMGTLKHQMLPQRPLSTVNGISLPPSHFFQSTKKAPLSFHFYPFMLPAGYCTNSHLEAS